MLINMITINNSHLLSGIDSKILTSLHEIELILKWIGNHCKNCGVLLHLRRSEEEDGTPQEFHKRCDLYYDTIIIIKLTDGSIIGGYVSETWKGEGYKEDPNPFLFNLILKRNMN